MSFTLRRAQVADAPAVARVHCASWRSTYPGIVPDPVILFWSNTSRRTESWTGIIAAAPGTVWLAERGGEVLGFANSGPCRHDSPCAGGQLFAAYLLAGMQRQGIGHALLRAVIEDMLAAGHQAGCCEVIPGNIPAVNFYKKTGARFDREAPFEMAGHSLVEHVLIWDDLRQTRLKLHAMLGAQ
jgi:ribosomal protein S18 acetylase RimI-like enzyme